MERLEVVGRVEHRVKLLGQVDRHVDHVGEQLRPEQRPDAPHAERGRPLRAFQVHDAAVVVGQLRRGRIEQVRRILVERGDAVLAVAVEQHRAQRRHEHHLVGVADDAVGLLDAGEQVAMPRAERQRAAVGRIDVQPDFVPAADVGDVGERIERADRRRARGGRDGDHRHAARPQVGKRVVQSIRDPCGGGSSSAARMICSVPRPRMPADRVTE